VSRKVGEKQMKCSGFWQCFSKKEAFAVYLEGLGTAASEDNGIKKIVGVNFEGLGGTPQAESSPIKTIVGYNFVGLGLVNSSAAQGSQDEWDESIEDTASQESGDTNGEWGYDQSAEYYNFSESSTIVYVGETSIPLASYRNTFGKYLWIENYGGLSEYASIPQYSGLSLIAYTSTGGQGEFLEIVIQDNGMGVKPEDMKKVFTPFFTTKVSSRKGTGLGLYVIRTIITDTHHGKIAFDSTYKTGTTFTLHIPLAPAV